MHDLFSLSTYFPSDWTCISLEGMIPIDFGSSDGLFNLGSAMGFVQSLPQGVYIAMNGKIFNSNNVKKNIDLGKFENKE